MIEVCDIYTLERHLRESIPLARAMELQVVDYDGYRLALSAPLGPNINDKGCAFGGSMSSLLTLAGWGLVNLKLAELKLSADIYIQDSYLSYLTPVWGEIVAEAYVSDADWTAFVSCFRDKNKARVSIEAEISGIDGAGIAAKQTSHYVAKIK
jgi:thioesterase domain-containing protein